MVQYLTSLYTKPQLKALDDLERMVIIGNRDARDVFPGSDTMAKQSQGQMSLNTILSRLYNIEKGVVGKGFVIRELAARVSMGLLGKHSEDVAKDILSRAYADPRFATELMRKVRIPDIPKQAGVLRRHLMAMTVTAPKEEEPNAN